MISKELLIELKEAGYPFKTKWIGFSYFKDGEYIQYEIKGDVGDDGLLVPSLSELIEACGDKFEKLIRFTAPTEEEKELTKRILGVEAPHWRAFTYERTADGSTLEEAVAKLYIELNKK